MSAKKTKKKKSLFRRIIKWFAYLLLLLIAAIIILPIVFEDEIVQAIKDIANESVNAKIDFGEYDLTIFSSFPDFTLEMNDVSVDGVEEFEGVSLAKVDKLVVTIDLMSVINGEKYELHKIGLYTPAIHAKVLEDGKANWDIAIADSTATEEVVEEAGEELAFSVGLEELIVENGTIIYDDASLNTYMSLVGLNHTTSGDFTQDIFVMKNSTTIDTADFSFEGVKYMHKGYVDLKADLDMDMPNMKFTFKENEVKVNELVLGFDGFVAMPADDIDMDITFQAKQTEFRNLLSMVPAVFKRDFASVKTSGKLGLDGYVKGTYNEELMPAFAANLKVDDARFQYPDLPAAVENIQIDAGVKSEGGKDLDNTIVDVSKFHIELAANPVDVRLKVTTPISDPNIDCSIKSQLDLANLAKVVPMEEGEEYNGKITADVTLKGRMSTLENEQYEEFQALGQIILLDMNYKSADVPYGMAISKSYFNFSPQFLELSTFESTIGQSDLNANGRIDNYLAYVFKDEPLTGTFNVSSNSFDLNELMAGYEEEEGEAAPAEGGELPAEETELSVIEVPKNIDFTMGASFGKLIYDQTEITGVDGQVIVRDQQAILKDLKMEVCEGDVLLNGTYNTVNPSKPAVDFKYSIANMDIKQSATAFNTVDKMAPIAKKCTGKFSTDLNLKLEMDDKMEPIYESITGNGTLTSNSVYIEGFEPLNKLASALKIDRLAKQTINDVKIAYEFKDGKIFVDPYDVKFGKIDATIAGNTSFEQEIDYRLTMKIPRSELGSKANEVMDGLLAQANNKGANLDVGETIDVSALMGGTVDKPTVKTDLADLGKNAVEDIKEEVKEVVEEKIEEVKEEVKENVNEQIEKIMKDAEEQAAKIRSEANKAAEKVRKEGYANADKLVAEAKNPIAKAAAKKAAEKMRKETDKKADAIIAEGDKKANGVIAAAQKKADALKQ